MGYNSKLSENAFAIALWDWPEVFSSKYLVVLQLVVEVFMRKYIIKGASLKLYATILALFTLLLTYWYLYANWSDDVVVKVNAASRDNDQLIINITGSATDNIVVEDLEVNDVTGEIFSLGTFGGTMAPLDIVSTLIRSVGLRSRPNIYSLYVNPTVKKGSTVDWFIAEGDTIHLRKGDEVRVVSYIQRVANERISIVLRVR